MSETNKSRNFGDFPQQKFLGKIFLSGPNLCCYLGSRGTFSDYSSDFHMISNPKPLWLRFFFFFFSNLKIIPTKPTMKRGNYGNSGATLWHLLSNPSWPKLKQLTNWKAEPPLDLLITLKKQHWKIIVSPFAMLGVSNIDGWARSFSFSLKIVVLLIEQTNFFPETISQWCSSSKHKKAIHWIFFNHFFVHAIGHKDGVLWMTNLILNISYFVGVNQVHYFPYVFYTCQAGNCIVDKNCLFWLVRRKTEQLRSR